MGTAQVLTRPNLGLNLLKHAGKEVPQLINCAVKLAYYPVRECRRYETLPGANRGQGTSIHWINSNVSTFGYLSPRYIGTFQRSERANVLTFRYSAYSSINPGRKPG